MQEGIKVPAAIGATEAAKRHVGIAPGQGLGGGFSPRHNGSINDHEIDLVNQDAFSSFSRLTISMVPRWF